MKTEYIDTLYNALQRDRAVAAFNGASREIADGRAKALIAEALGRYARAYADELKGDGINDGGNGQPIMDIHSPYNDGYNAAKQELRDKNKV